MEKIKCTKCNGTGLVSIGPGIRGLERCKACHGLGEHEIRDEFVKEKEFTYSIKHELISAEEKLEIDNNWEDIVHKYTREYMAAKEQALCQYVMKKQQDEIDRLREENKKLENNWNKLRKMIEDSIIALHKAAIDPTAEFIENFKGTFGRVLNMMNEIKESNYGR